MPRIVSPISIAVGLCAGIAASLLVLSPVGGATFAVPLTMITALPIVIAALGWGTMPAIAGVLAGTVLLLMIAPGLAVYFACFIAPPALIGCYLAGLARPVVREPAPTRPVVEGGDAHARMEAAAIAATMTSGGDRRPLSARPTIQWFPIGQILVIVGAAVCVGSVIVAIASGFDPATLPPDRAHEIAKAYVAAMGEQQAGTTTDELIAAIEPTIATTLKILPFAFVATWTLIFAFNLGLGYWITLKSGTLTRPAEPFTALAIPRFVAPLVVVAVAIAFTGGRAGALFAAIGGAGAGLLLIQGLAVIHTLVRRLSFRLPLLILIYLFLSILSVPLLVVGALEPYLRLRDRLAPAARPSR